MPAKKPIKKKSPVKKKSSARVKRGQRENVRESLKKLLLEHRKRILREAKEEISKFIKGESKQLVDSAMDDGDWSVIDLAEDINLRKLSAHKASLNQIDEALRRVEEGTYGICEDCGSEISEARLKVIPFALQCIECKEHRERLEEFEKGEQY